ncbi:MAG: glycosyltransferase family 4 protein [Candidatus Saccharibacteria bacterium]
MNVLWVTWKDMAHPEAGGAEVVADELCRRLVEEGNHVMMLTTDYPGASSTSPTPGVEVIRVGSSRYTHPMQALWFYICHLRNKYDAVIEEVNGGAPYFTVFFGRQAPRYMLYHQLARVNWLYEIPKPFSYIGYYLVVPIATRIAAWARTPLITVSESSKNVLRAFGFDPAKTYILSEGIKIDPITDLSKVQKFDRPTVLSHGGMRAMKRTIDQIKAFEIAKKTMPDLQLKVSGSSSGAYGKKVMSYIAKSPYKSDIEYLGRTTDEQKIELMQRSHAILVTSVEEGWGLIVTEANSQGTPAIVYDVAGLRDSVKHAETGIVTAENPAALADGIVTLLHNEQAYEPMRKNGWQWSKTITFDQSYKDLKKALEIA